VGNYEATHVIGAKILKGASADFIKLAESISLNHHENGTQRYPQGIKGPDIPLLQGLWPLPMF